MISSRFSGEKKEIQEWQTEWWGSVVNKIYYRIECEWVCVRKERKISLSKMFVKIVDGWNKSTTQVMFGVKRSFHYPFIDFLLDQRFLSFLTSDTHKKYRFVFCFVSFFFFPKFRKFFNSRMQKWNVTNVTNVNHQEIVCVCRFPLEFLLSE